MEKFTEAYKLAFEKILPVVRKKPKTSYVTAAILLIAFERIYSFFKVPKNLRHFPSVSYFSMVKVFITKQSPTDRVKRLVLPVIKKANGFYISKIPFIWTVYLANPIAVKQFLLKTDTFPKSHAIMDMLADDSPGVLFLGKDNVALTNDADWKRQRKVMNPAFNRSMPIKTMGSVVGTLFSIIDKEGGTIPVSHTMQDFTLDILGHIIFGFDFKAMKGDPDDWTKLYRTVIDTMFDPIVNILGPIDFLLCYVYPKRQISVEATRKINAKFDLLAKQKRAEIQSGAHHNIPDNEKDLLMLMLEAEEKGDTFVSDEQLRHNIAVLFLAGHDTTAHSLSFCFYHLAKNKHVQEKLRQEVIGVLGDDPVDIVPTVEQMKTMDYLNMVVKENLRMNTPADTIAQRDTKEDMVLADQLIPKGTIVNIDIHAIHHNPEYWHDPETFIPERFGKGGEQESHKGLTWLPFGNGTRQCIGMNFSLAEQRLVLAMMVRKYEIDIPKDSIHYDHIIHDAASNAAPKSLELTFKRRY